MRYQKCCYPVLRPITIPGSTSRGVVEPVVLQVGALEQLPPLAPPPPRVPLDRGLLPGHEDGFCALLHRVVEVQGSSWGRAL